MMQPTVHPGHVLPLYRRVDALPDPLALFATLTDGGRRRDTLLLESADAATGAHERSVLVPRAALRVECVGDAVHVRALTTNGAALLPWLEGRLVPRGFTVRPLRRARAAGKDAAGERGERERTPTEELPAVDPEDSPSRTQMIGPKRGRDPRPGRSTEQLDALGASPGERSTLRIRPSAMPREERDAEAGLPALEILPPPSPAGPRDEATRLREPSVLDVLRTLVLGVRCISAPSPMAHFAAGILDYDLIDLWEVLPPARDAHGAERRFAFWIPETCVLIDHRSGSTTVLASVFGGDGAEAAYHDATRQVEQLTRAVQAAPAAGDPGGGRRAPEAPSDVETDTPDEVFEEKVRQLKRHIVAGDVFQIVPSRSFRTPCPNPLAAYGVLRRTNPSPYMFLVHEGDEVLFGASPETCVRVRQPERRIEICPIAGTARRGRTGDGSLDPDLDTRLEAELRADTKELAEHMMLVDLARNDVARVSVRGTRQVSRLLTVERYSHVMHLVSVVEGELAPDLDALHAYAACMNMGTLVGAPKIRAAELLRQHETSRRGAYGGAVGFLTFRGEMNTAIVIRSAVVRDGVATVRAGAGVVHDSVPAREAEETRRKAASVLAAITTANLGIPDPGDD